MVIGQPTTRQPLLAEDVFGVLVGAAAIGLFGGEVLSAWPVIGVYWVRVSFHLLAPFQDADTWAVFLISVGFWPASAMAWMLWDRFGWRRHRDR